MPCELTANGSTFCRILDWDSALFGFKVARILSPRATVSECKMILEWAHDQRVTCIYWLSDPSCRQSAEAAHENGFMLADVRVTMEYNTLSGATKPSLASQVNSLRLFHERDRSAVYELLTNAFRSSRFFFDSNFDPTKVNQMYRTWIDNCIGHETSAVIVADEGDIVGLLACSAPAGLSHATLELIFVAPKTAGRGLGKVFDEVKKRPLYIIKESRNLPE